MMAERDVFQCTVFYSGRVQGVGFRYQALRVAREFDVSGYVRNLGDGRVQLEAEGDESQVRAFVAEVERRLGVFIRKAEPSCAVRARLHKGFAIR